MSVRARILPAGACCYTQHASPSGLPLRILQRCFQRRLYADARITSRQACCLYVKTRNQVRYKTKPETFLSGCGMWCLNAHVAQLPLTVVSPFPRIRTKALAHRTVRASPKLPQTLHIALAQNQVLVQQKSHGACRLPRGPPPPPAPAALKRSTSPLRCAHPAHPSPSSLTPSLHRLPPAFVACSPAPRLQSTSSGGGVPPAPHPRETHLGGPRRAPAQHHLQTLRRPQSVGLQWRSLLQRPRRQRHRRTPRNCRRCRLMCCR